MTVRAAILALLCAATSRPAQAQLSRFLEGDVSVARVHFASTSALGGEALSGIVVGGRARLVLGVTALELSYAEGHLAADTGNAPSRDFVDGSVFLAVRPVAWLTVRAGPHLRGYVESGGTERWLLWEGRVRAEAPIVAGTLRARVEGWTSLASGVNADPGASGARGAEVGMALRLPRSPFVFRLSYTVDQESMKSGIRTEALESVALSVGLGGQ